MMLPVASAPPATGVPGSSSTPTALRFPPTLSGGRVTGTPVSGSTSEGSPTPQVSATTAFATSTPTHFIVRPGLWASDPSTFRISSGKVQLVEFFAFWSPESKSMATILHGLEEVYGEQIRFFYLDVDDVDNRIFMQELGYRFAPHIFLLDGQGNVLHEWLGFTPAEILEAAILSAIA